MDVRIDRLSLRVPGMNPDTARQFGRLVAERLGVLLAAQAPASSPARVTSLRVHVLAPADGNPDSLATAMATEISRVLRTEVTR